MKYVSVALLVVMLAASTFGARPESEYRDMFRNYMKEHKKVYKHDEFHGRYSTFKKNLDFIEAHNASGKSYTLAMNKFGDLSSAEMKQLFNGVRVSSSPKKVATLPTAGVPTSVDWRKADAVTPVKNQGQCGSCWSFSTTGSLEGLNAITNRNLKSFSEQQLVDCSGSYGNNGCDGGLMDDAFQYVEAEGIELESVYPYTAEDGTCQYSASSVVFKNTGYTDVPADTPSQLTAAVAQQPVSIAIEADQSVFQFYSGGVLNDQSCGTNLDHGVLIVGYNSDAGQPYWIVKNSWGADWGQSGYVWIARDTQDGGPGICGINSMPSYPTGSASL